jgi:hypothetical protein
VEYQGVYPGIDLVYYGNSQTQLEYDFDIAPGASPAAIQLAFRATQGLAVEGRGDLVLHTAGGDVTEQAPVAYQVIDGARQAVAVRYVLEANGQVGFAVGAHNPTQALVINPVLSYATCLGGNTGAAGEQEGNAIAVDGAGNAYVTGVTPSTSFPTTAGAFQTTGSGVFVSKLNATGTALVYSTYLGPGVGTGIAVNSAGHAYVTGTTTSTSFPTTAGAFQATYPGTVATPSAFVTELNPSGSALVYSTYLGGSGQILDEGLSPFFVGDGATGIALDGAGDAYVTGSAQSTNFPTTAGAFQTTLAGSEDAFVTELNASGTGLVYSTDLGGSNPAAGATGSFATGAGIAVDGAGNAYLTGQTSPTNFPTTAGAFQTTSSGGGNFITTLNPAGSGLVYSTYLGGNLAVGYPAGIAVDSSGDAYITGGDGGTVPTTADAFQTTPAGAFVSELNPSGTALVYSTYLGGSNGRNAGHGIAVDSAGNFYVTGQTTASNFPTTAGAFQTTYVGTGNVGEGFVAKFAAAGIALGPASLPAATVGVAYSQTLTVQGGTAPYSFAVTAGALPAGLTLSLGGTLSGTPTAAGSATFTVTATDSTGTAGSRAYTLTTRSPTLRVAGFPSPSTAGAAGSFTVTALDANGNVLPGYTGTVHFTSSDPRAVLPADYTFTAADQGVHAFSATLKTAGGQSITATDTASGSSTGSEAGITVTAAAAARFLFSAPGSVTHGVGFSVTLTVEDAYGNIVTGYLGTAHFRSSDGTATLPANYTFTAADAGVHTFTNVVLRKRGKQTLTATDTLNGALTATDTISVG